MKCPYCTSPDTKVTDTRETADSDVTRRRRECIKCKRRFTTYERVEVIDLVIVKKDKTRESFDRDKLMRGMMKACEKRPVKVEKIEQIVDEIEQDLRSRDAREIPSKIVGELVMEKLKKIDEVAYVRFASVYRQFKDAKQFVNEIEDFLQKTKKK